MYPKNAASPEPIAIGAVVQISDGAVQTSGVTVRVKPIGVAEADGTGTTSYSTDGVVYYTPAQSETNYTSFILIAKKTGCLPVSVTIVTTSSATPGTVLLAPVTHTSAVVPTVTTLTGHTAQTGDAFARLGAPAGASIAADIATRQVSIWSSAGATVNLSGTTIATTQKVDVETIKTNPVVNAGTITFPTGATLASTTNITAGTLTTVTNLTNDPSGVTTLLSRLSSTRAGYLDNLSGGAVALASGVAVTSIGANVVTAASLATDAVQEIRNAITGGAYALDTDANGRVRIVDGTGTGELDTSSGLVAITTAAINAIADQVWDEVLSGHLTGGTTGAGLNAAGSAGDPWGTALPGAYSAGTAGYIVGTNLNATVGSRSSHAAADVWSVTTRAITDKAGFTISGTTTTLDALITSLNSAHGAGSWATATGFSTHSASDVWAVATRLLTAGTNIVLAKGTGITGFNDLDAAGVRSAVGLATANLDTQLATLLAAIPTTSEIRIATNGGDYALDTDALGRIRIVDGTGAGELDTASGLVKISGTIQTLDALDTAQDAEHDATQLLLAAISKLLRADQYIDTAQTPWEQVYIEEATGDLTTGVRLLTKQLFDTAGGDLTDTSTVVGQVVGA